MRRETSEGNMKIEVYAVQQTLSADLTKMRVFSQTYLARQFLWMEVIRVTQLYRRRGKCAESRWCRSVKRLRHHRFVDLSFPLRIKARNLRREKVMTMCTHDLPIDKPVKLSFQGRIVLEVIAMMIEPSNEKMDDSSASVRRNVTSWTSS